MASEKLTLQQQRAVENRDGTLLVSAAAGSGKTKVLVDRVMSRIRQEGKNINEFLIITFTNAAAAELRAKISNAILKALAEEPENRHLQQQMKLIQLAQISTVHAFCGNLIRQYGYQIEVASDYSMMETAEKNEMLERLLNDLLEEKYAEGEQGFLLLTDTLGAGRNDDGLVSLLLEVFEKLESQPFIEKWLEEQNASFDPHTPLEKTVWGEMILDSTRKKIGWLIEKYDWAISEMVPDELLQKSYLPAYQQQRTQIAEILPALSGPWDEIGRHMEITYPSVRVSKHPDPDLVDAVKAVKDDGKKLIRKLQQPFLRPAQTMMEEQNRLAPAIHSLYQIEAELYRRFQNEKRNRNLMDFSDQEHLAIRLLVDEDEQPTETAKEVSKRFCEIMVDEYQDSNRIQELIFRAISDEYDANRFLVGDVKQSIYGFRQAEPKIFLGKYQSFLEAEEAKKKENRRLVLSKNFRSRPEILDAVNHTFSCIMSEGTGDLRYGAEERLYPGLEEYPRDSEKHTGLYVLELEGAGENEENQKESDMTKYQREAIWVTNRISDMLEKGLPVRDGDRLRPVQPADIAILFRSWDAVGIYRKTLLKAGLPVASEGGENLFSVPEVRVLLNLLRVADNPHQDIPLLAALCSPLFRLSNDQLAVIRNDTPTGYFYDAMRNCNEDWCRKATAKLERLRREAKAMSAEQFVWTLLYDYGLMTAYSAMENGEEKKKNLLAVYELARNTAGNGYLYLYQLLRVLERQAAGGEKTGSGGSDGIKLTTIHKSKGLEYPVVFLVDLARKFNFQELNNAWLYDSDYGLAAKMTDLGKRIRYPGVCYEALQMKKRQELLAEEMRVLYVAMTRPKDYLFMVYSAAKCSFENRLAGVGVPAAEWAVAEAKSLGDWVLLAALARIEGGNLLENGVRPRCGLVTDGYPWEILRERVGWPEIRKCRYCTEESAAEGDRPLSPDRLRQALLWEYPHKDASMTPSKLTATQLKGRDKDSEVAEFSYTRGNTVMMQKPEFILKKQGLSPTEKGTATHLFLQYADYRRLITEDGIQEELDRMVDEEYLNQQQADAVYVDQILKLFSGELGRRLMESEQVIREFKFSILVDAAEYYPEIHGEEVLLQGVVDAALVEPDGITVVDFKTDRVSLGSVMQRAEHYRGQLESYRKALERIFHKPVKSTILYFLSIGEEVRL